jgi:hypothetical protein
LLHRVLLHPVHAGPALARDPPRGRIRPREDARRTARRSWSSGTDAASAADAVPTAEQGSLNVFRFSLVSAFPPGLLMCRLYPVHTVFPYPSRPSPNDANNTFLYFTAVKGKAGFHRIKGFVLRKRNQKAMRCGMTRGNPTMSTARPGRHPDRGPAAHHRRHPSPARRNCQARRSAIGQFRIISVRMLARTKRKSPIRPNRSGQKEGEKE